MGSKTSDIEGTILSVVKVLPAVGGAVLGLVYPAFGDSDSPVEKLFGGNWKGAVGGLIANYTFYDPPTGKFKMEQGRGVKGLVAGTVVTKILRWI